MGTISAIAPVKEITGLLCSRLVSMRLATSLLREAISVKTFLLNFLDPGVLCHYRGVYLECLISEFGSSLLAVLESLLILWCIWKIESALFPFEI